MREIRLSGSEGGGDREVSPYPYQIGDATCLALRPLWLRPCRAVSLW